jgi:type IV pilus assembly protein PilA
MMYRTHLVRPFSKRRGFTLVELLVVVLILAILMSIALPLYLSAIGDAQKKTCRTNLQTIANTVQAARVKLNLADYTTLYSANVATDIAQFPDLVLAPLCPSGGIYGVSAGTKPGNFKVTCSIALHGSFEPGVDNN